MVNAWDDTYVVADDTSNAVAVIAADVVAVIVANVCVSQARFVIPFLKRYLTVSQAQLRNYFQELHDSTSERDCF
jgi:hypothetical protein|tara:strand:+ start:6033 stop:6257 length:225 start_codon:yes stop_codon:yes gene_type:complete